MVTVEHLTGESEPLEKKVGDLVPGGARNIDGMLIIKVWKCRSSSAFECEKSHNVQNRAR